ncbi:MAG: nucleotidyltransferase domain-containing protein [Cyanobacteria bacterium J06638_28]
MTSYSPQTKQETLEQRRQVALRVARESDRLLRDRFGATDVIVFGSLAGQGPWHWDSDLDLAVAGLTFERWLLAADAVRAIMPHWLAVDLVRLEALNPAVRRRVLQPVTMTQNKLLTLKTHLEDEVLALDACVAELLPAIERAKERQESYDFRALASYINDFYRRCERMSERVAVTLDGGLPQVQNWPPALLRQLAEPNADRPPLWSGALLFDLDEYRHFRHVVHHKYGSDLRPDYVMHLAELAPEVTPQIKAAIAHFNDWLTHSADQYPGPAKA